MANPNTDLRDANPLCGNCQNSMNPRDDGSWFCPSCADYGHKLGMVTPTAPTHPVFEDIAKDDPEILVGMYLMRYPFKGDEESLGTIQEYDPSEGEFRITTDLDEPFDFTERIIDEERFFEYLWTPNKRGDRPPEKLRLGVMI